MKFPSPKITSFHAEVLQQTRLGQLCGSEERFRNRYQVQKMIGRGGYGITFLVKDWEEADQPLRVIKFLRPHIQHPKALAVSRQRFQREAKILEMLGKHPQIPALTDYFVLEDDFYLVQEYVNGITLARWIRRYGPQSEYTVKRFLRGMLQLLQYVHQRKVIHRDIKPHNIILRRQDRRLALIDFGSVKDLLGRSVESQDHSPTTHFIGTAGFAPPEQFSLRVVYASDLYALGVTCLYLLTGKAPLRFACDRRTGMLEWQDEVDLSPRFQGILQGMLHPALEKRYKSAIAVLDALNQESPQDNLEGCLNVVKPTSPSSRPPQSPPNLTVAKEDE